MNPKTVASGEITAVKQLYFSYVYVLCVDTFKCQLVLLLDAE